MEAALNHSQSFAFRKAIVCVCVCVKVQIHCACETRNIAKDLRKP